MHKIVYGKILFVKKDFSKGIRDNLTVLYVLFVCLFLRPDLPVLRPYRKET